ncbi:hypothetical protein C4J81_10260 [Deltaproteobacteria bacterium Smac51]|nr:hypothetical protein C4J81_10260 [Deltaproteobacteria bacterium Smac51]
MLWHEFETSALSNIERFFGTMNRDMEKASTDLTSNTEAEQTAIRERTTWVEHIMSRTSMSKNEYRALVRAVKKII